MCSVRITPGSRTIRNLGRIPSFGAWLAGSRLVGNVTHSEHSSRETPFREVSYPDGRKGKASVSRAGSVIRYYRYPLRADWKPSSTLRVARHPPIDDTAGMIHLGHGNMPIGFALFSIVYFVTNASFPR